MYLLIASEFMSLMNMLASRLAALTVWRGLELKHLSLYTIGHPCSPCTACKRTRHYS